MLSNSSHNQSNYYPKVCLNLKHDLLPSRQFSFCLVHSSVGNTQSAENIESFQQYLVASGELVRPG